LTSPLRRPRRDTFAEVVRARLGPTVAREFYDPYIRKLWDADPDDLSGELARRRVSASSPADVARRLLRGRTPEGRSFLYPRRGFGQVSEALADAAVEEGADVRLSTAVEGVRIHDDGNGVALTLADGSVIEAAMAWSTVPLPALVGMADPAPPADVAAAAAVLRHRALLLVYLVLDRSHYTEFDAHYFPGLDVPMARLSEPRNYRHDPDAPPSTTVLCAEVPCWEGDDHWNASPDDLAALVADGLARAGLPPVGPVAVEIRRLPRVYPVYRPGFEADVAAVQAWEDAQPALVSFGRQGLFVPDNTHHALAMGTAAAACLGDRFDDAAWRAARDGFAAHVVED
ncbi:MAG TPA: FAD-dependent oxidoreductase, partial [Acidimicrobiia bacterium]|nr:FAD-dependent oxidoreductase [Acidimicrobiia bacterium]